MKFRFLRDPLFLISLAMFSANELLWKPAGLSDFSRHHFNDCLLIPCALPLVLLIQRRLGLRSHERPPTMAEVFGHLALWSVLFEILGPRLFQHATGDWRDIVCYWLFGVLSWAFWNRPKATPTAGAAAHEL